MQQPIPSILVLLAVLAYVSIKVLNRLQSTRSERLKWWQKLAGIVAFISVLMIAINPEFLPLGFLGDTAFFDLMVLLISVQLQIAVAWVWSWGGATGLKLVRWAIAPSPHMSYLLVAWTIASVVSAIHKLVQRISS
jgi:hypothetical protein